jgi:hypothetical protein
VAATARFIPSGSEAREFPELGAVVYVTRTNGTPYGVAYHGKAGRPDWNYRFRNDAGLKAHGEDHHDRALWRYRGADGGHARPVLDGHAPRGRPLAHHRQARGEDPPARVLGRQAHALRTDGLRVVLEVGRLARVFELVRLSSTTRAGRRIHR